MKYSIALDLLLASVQASTKGKYKQSARLFDAAIKSKDFASTVASLDKIQSAGLSALKEAQKAKRVAAATDKAKAEKAKAAKVAATAKKPTTAKKVETKAAPATKPETAGQRMASFLKEIHKTKQATASATATKKAKKPVKASEGDDFNSIIDQMTEASTVDSILDPALDLNTQKDDADSPDTESILRSGPDASKPAQTADAEDGDPSPGDGESDLDTDQDDLMDLDDVGDLSDLQDLSDADFTSAASDADGMGAGDDADTYMGGDESAAADDEDGDEDGDDDKGGNPFAKKDDKEEGKAKSVKAKSAPAKAAAKPAVAAPKAAQKASPVKESFTRTVHNLAALDRLSALTAALVSGTAKKPVKAASKPAKTASKK